MAELLEPPEWPPPALLLAPELALEWLAPSGDELLLLCEPLLPDPLPVPWPVTPPLTPCEPTRATTTGAPSDLPATLLCSEAGVRERGATKLLDS